MKIKTLTASGIKGGSFSHALGPVTVFSGPFGSGKTSRLDAICLGLLGYSPRLGKRPGDSFRLASGEAMRVKLTLEGGGGIERRWERADGSVKFTGPKDPAVPAVLLDYREFFSLSGPERLGLLAGRMDSERLGFKVEGISAHIIRAIEAGCPDLSEMFHAQIRTEFEKMSGDLDRARQEEGASVQDWIETFLAQAQAKLKAANDAVKTMTGAARAGVQLSGVSGNVPRDCSTEIQAAEAERDRLKKIDADFKARDRAIAEKDSEAAGIRAKVAKLPEWQKYVADLRAMIAAQEAVAAGYKPSDIGLRLGEAQGLVREITRKRQEAERTMADAAEEHEGHQRLPHCPFCKHKGKGWRKEIDAAYAARCAEWDAAYKLTVAELAQAEAKRVALEAEWNKHAAAETAYEQARATLAEARPKLAKAERDLAAIEADQVRVDTILAQREGLANEQFGAALNWQAAQEALPAAESKLAALRQERDRWVAMKAEDKAAARAQQELRAQADRAAAFKVAVETLRAVQAELIQRSMVALLEPANKLTAGFLPGPFEYEAGDFGYRRPGGEWVSHATFCGTEALVAYAGLSVALAQEAPTRIVLLDGLDIDWDGKAALWKRLVDLVADGTLHQVVATDVSASSVAVDGITMIRLERRPA